MPKVSIIIAMYNIESYIAYCINSCINQESVNPEDYEIIIVNDGSTDNSFEVAKESIKCASNARIITRDNGGLSAARNTGIEHAKGDYLWFVDGDDAIAPNALNVLISNINRSNSDAYIVNFSTFDGINMIATSNFKGSETPISGKEYHFQHNRILPMMAWLTIYKSEVLRRNSIYFMPGIQHEDLEFSVRAHHMSNSIFFIESSLYLYRVGRDQSIMSDVRKDNTNSLVSQVNISNSFKSFFNGVENDFVRRLYGMCATTFFIRRYDLAFVPNSTTQKLISDYKYVLYKDIWNSKYWKMRLLLIFIIVNPECVLKYTLPKIGNRSKLM